MLKTRVLRPALPVAVGADVTYHEACEGEAEDSGDVRDGAVDLRLAERVCLYCIGGVGAEVGQQLVAIDAHELAARALSGLPETLAQRTRQGTALHLPELGDADARRVHPQRLSLIHI